MTVDSRVLPRKVGGGKEEAAAGINNTAPERVASAIVFFPFALGQ